MNDFEKIMEMTRPGREPLVGPCCFELAITRMQDEILKGRFIYEKLTISELKALIVMLNDIVEEKNNENEYKR